MADKVSLKQQVDAVELAALNQRGHANNLSDLVKKGRRSEQEVVIARLPLPALDAAAKTLSFLADHETEFRALLEKPE